MTDADVFAAFRPEVLTQTPLRAAITAAYRRPEPECVPPLLAMAGANPDEATRIEALARNLVASLRAKTRSSGVEGLIHEYSLSSQEGVALMCLAEALLRIPDAATRDALIRDKIAPRRLARPSRPQPVAVRQRRDLGPGADRPPGDDDQRAGPVGGADPPDRAQRRADHPPRRRRRHAPDGRAVRHRPDDRGGDRQRPRARGARLHLLLRHAGRSGDQRRGRGALSRRVPARRPRHRQGLASPRHLRGAGHFDQAFGAAPALPADQARPRDGRAPAAGQGACGAGQVTTTSASTSTPRRPTGSTCRSIFSRRSASTRISPAGTASASSSRPMASAARSSSTGSSISRAAQAAG